MRSSHKFTYVCVLFIIGVHSGYSARSYTQSTQMILNSIDERLRNLDKSSTYRYADGGDQHVRKLEALEGRIERFETMLAARLERLEGNISVQHFKDDLVQDQILRRIDAVYERVHHRIAHIEIKIDAHERKITEKLESMLKKFEHLEENCNRRTETDEELAEVFEVVDEMKTVLHAGVENATQIMHKKFDILQEKLEQDRRGLADDVQHLEAIVNSSRYEQQNAMRNLVVLVGRIGGKNNAMPADGANGNGCPSGLSQQLTNVSRDIAARFDTLMEQQSVFADSCHRIQSDEPQLESKISEILEKIIDVFEKESAVEIKDIQNIEQLIKSHDTSVRRSLFTTSHNMAVLLQKAREHKDELALQVAAVQAAIAGLESRLNYTSLSEDGISKLISDLREDVLRNSSQVQVQTLLDALRTVVAVLSANVTEHPQETHAVDGAGSIDKNNIKIIEELRKLNAKIDAVDTHALNENIASLVRRYIDEYSLNAAIQEVFGYNPANSTNTTAPVISDASGGPSSDDDERIVFEEMAANCTSIHSNFDVRVTANKCNETNNKNRDDAVKFPITDTENSNSDIDVRSSDIANFTAGISHKSEET